MNFGGLDLIRSIKEYSLQKNLKFSEVMRVIENVLRDSEIKKYGYDKIRVELLENGKINLNRQVRVTDKNELNGSLDEEGYQCISLDRAKDIVSAAEVDQIIEEKISDLSLMRFEICLAKRSFYNNLNNLIRQRQYDDFKDHVGKIFSFLILRVENNNLILVYNSVETILYHNKLIKGEVHRKGDKIKVYIEDVIRVDRGAQIIVSRTHKNFVAELFRQNIPEIYENIVEIKAVARFAGIRCKIAVYSADTAIDAVGACIGIKGTRINSITNEINGEKIDVILFSNDLLTFLRNIFGNDNVLKANFREESIDLVVLSEKISLVIGKQGQNINLASALINKRINVINAEDESKRLVNKFELKTNLLIDTLEIEKVMAQLLVLNDFDSIEKINSASIADIVNIEGFDEDIAKELLERASDYIKNNSDNFSFENAKINNLTSELICILYKNNINNLEDLANLSVDELNGIVNGMLDDNIKNQLIIDCRASLGWI